MTEQINDKRQAELPWPGKRARCPKCRGAGDVHRTLQHVSSPAYEVIGGKRVTSSACGGSGNVCVPMQIRGG